MSTQNTSQGTRQAPSQEQIYQQSLELARTASGPGIIPYMEDEVVRFEEEVARFRAGQMEERAFQPFRLRQGIYGQRQADVQMIRVKIPGGILTPEALEALGEIAEKYAPLGKGHLTTRENVQYHHVPLPSCATVMRLLGDVGLSTREACGNTVRNVVGSPTAGVCPDEVFDPTPYLAAYVRFGMRHPLAQNFPRKFKTSFSGCDQHDAVASLIHDGSFVSQIRVVNGVEKRGFRVYIGGGSSIMPKLAKPLYDFVPVEDFLRVSQAVWAVFNNADILRKNRMMARIKVLIDKIGMDAFRALVDAELARTGPIDPTPLMNLEELHRETPPKPARAGRNGHQQPEEFRYWRETTAKEQKQAGFYMATIKIPLGDITPPQFYALADLVRKHTGGRTRVTQEQNLLLRWIPEANLHAVWQALKKMGFADPDADSITDIVSCPGTDSCKLGITSSMGLGQAIRESMASWNGLLEDPLVKKMHIKMSGCPNGCSQHHVASIGFHGAAMKGPTGEQVPAYEVLLGGSYGGASIDGTRYGQRLAGMKVPAKAVPAFVRDVTAFYHQNRKEGEEFSPFVDRVGTKAFEPLAAPYRELPALTDQTVATYMDWSKTMLYKVERGEGECAI
ncbi:MAG: nitrite/sulfite reductase [Dehalococcoidia bacterium]|nr:nitrite/sulfite reductase [Dehalococcoidia bacterium]MSQ17152.1 nitrite/sulfite reductase [Dehalococcoidia bacterium]